MVAGDTSSGTIKIRGEVVNDLEPKDRGIAMVFQNYALYRWAGSPWCLPLVLMVSPFLNKFIEGNA